VVVASVVVSALSERNANATLFYACGLSWDGFTHGGAGPTPGSIIRVAAWLLFITVIVVRHSMAFTGHAEALHR
jgi:hypothetical protein